MSMLGRASELIDDLPVFTEEERRRINKVYHFYRNKYGYKVHFGTIPMLKKQDEIDLDVKERQLMQTAG